jgi:C-terminal peptidase (prc)
MAENKKDKSIKKTPKVETVKKTVKKPKTVKIEKEETAVEAVEEKVIELEKVEDTKIEMVEKSEDKAEKGFRNKLKAAFFQEDDVEVETVEKKTSFNLVEVIIVMIITAFFGALIGAAVTYVKTDEYYSVGDAEDNKYIKEFISTFNELNRDFYSEVSSKELIDSAIQGMIEKLGDPYSQYLDSSESKIFDEDLSGEFIGMGAEISLNSDGKVYISRLFEDAPAIKAGLKNADIIIKVNNESVEGLNTQEVASLIKNGNIGTTATITVIRDGNEMDFVITRDKVEIKSVNTEVLERNGKKIGLLTISAFNDNTDEQFLARYEELKKEKIDGLVIDVRNNNGGHLTVAKEVASLFLNKDDIVYQLDNKGNITKEKAGNKKIIDIPVVVVVNGGTASAAEILTAALKENLNAEVVGEKTYGKGTVQRVHKLYSGASIKYTINTWLTPKGNEVNQVGIEPTISVSLDENYYNNPSRENDAQLQSALDNITK